MPLFLYAKTFEIPSWFAHMMWCNWMMLPSWMWQESPAFEPVLSYFHTGGFTGVCGTGPGWINRPNIDPFCQGNLNMFEHLLSGALRNRGNFAPKNGPNKSCHVCFTHKRTTQDHPGPRSLVHGILKLSLRWASKNHVLSNNLIVWKDHLIWELHLSFFWDLKKMMFLFKVQYSYPISLTRVSHKTTPDI